MSQSPIDDFSPPATMRYKQGWKALNRLLHEDRSFSGHERNCAFLNVPGGDASSTFADVSAASGLDFDDDARGVATVDWDFDGKLDLWITNRTAPRVRLMRNGERSGHHFLAVLLEGDGQQTNRDAIGARLELHLAGDAGRTIVKGLRAGEGFLSQSSRWIHFGLGKNTSIERLVVDWPGGPRQEYAGLKADAWHIISQSTGSVTPWEPPRQRAALKPSQPQLPALTDQARIVAPPGLLMPPLPVGEDNRDLTAELRGPTLVNLWSTTCGACLEELAEWTREAERMRAAGLDVVAVNLDNLTDSAADAEQAIARLNFPFRAYQGTAQLVETLDIFQRALLDRWQRLPVPVSFLIDGQGRLAVLYKGRVTTEQLLADMRLLDAEAHQRRDAGTQFTGRWISEPAAADPLRVASQLIDSARIQQAMAYLQRYAERAAAAAGADRTAAGDVFYVLGVLLGDQSQKEEAIAAFRRALEYLPDDYRARNDLADLLAERGELGEAADHLAHALRVKPGDVAVLRKLGLVKAAQQDLPAAIEYFSQVIAAQPKDVASRFNLANAYRATGRMPLAIDQYRQTLTVEPNMTPAANNLAWILATHPDNSLRDGTEAVRWAEAACQRTGERHPVYLDTLAAAYAENGDYDRAVQSCQKAIDLLTQAGQADQSAGIRERRELYSSHQPFRDAGLAQ